MVGSWRGGYECLAPGRPIEHPEISIAVPTRDDENARVVALLNSAATAQSAVVVAFSLYATSMLCLPFIALPASVVIDCKSKQPIEGGPNDSIDGLNHYILLSA
jgi:hypothetical protein